MKREKEITLKGIPAAPGISIGKAFLLDEEEYIIAKRPIGKEDVERETKRFKDALSKTKKELLEIKKRISEELSVEHAQIFSAHLLVLEDAMLIDEVISKLNKELVVVEYVFQDVLKKYLKVFSGMDDDYLKERISDITDVGKRILRNLIGAKKDLLGEIEEEVIVVAYDLSPSDTASMHGEKVIGFATDIGGRTSHTAIMAKSLEIPAVVGLEAVTSKVKAGDTLVIDGVHGVVVINPSKDSLRRYRLEKKRFTLLEHGLLASRDLPCETLDGKKVELAANIELPEDIPSVISHGAEGIGLYRTEYLYMNRKELPTEEEQFKAYANAVKKVGPYAVIVRTLDLGGDKFLSQLEVPKEMNPFLGWRAIRFCLARPDIFKTQLKAVLRASVHGRMKVMYPMISGLSELRQANAILEEVKEELRKKAVPFDEKMEVGAMIEIPSAALTSDVLAKEVDFFSIGTNDLIQYALAVDRVNEKIAYLYEPAHPAVLRLVKNIIDNGHRGGIWVGMCGEMAGDITMTLMLLGLGLDEFSMSPIAVPEVKQVIRSVTMEQAKDLAQKCLEFSTAAEIEKFSREKLRELVPDLAVDIE